MIRVFLVEDHGLVCMGVRQLLETTHDIEVVGEARDGRAALDAVRQRGDTFDVLVLDLSLPRVGGLEVLKRTRVERPELAVLVVSMFPEEQYASLVLSLGAAGYVSKATAEHELIDAIRAVAGGKLHVSRSALSSFKVQSALDRPPHETLSGRENQIFVLVCEGRTVSEIAAELDLSVSTVSTHLGKIKTKLKVQTVAEIVHYAHRVGLIF